MSNRFTYFWYGLCVSALFFGGALALKDEQYGKQKAQIMLETSVAKEISTISDYMLLYIQNDHDKKLSDKDRKERALLLIKKINKGFEIIFKEYENYSKISADKDSLAVHFKGLYLRWKIIAHRAEESVKS